MNAEPFELGVLPKNFEAWIVSTVLMMILAGILYYLPGLLLGRMSSIVWSKVMAGTGIAWAADVSYSLGANDAGNAIGPLLSNHPDHGLWRALPGGAVMAPGAAPFGEWPTDTVGKSIRPLDCAREGHLGLGFGPE